MRHFRSRVDFFPLLVIVAALFLVDAAAMGFSLPAVTSISALTPLALYLVAAVLPVVLALAIFPVHYHLAAREVVVRSGLLRWNIPVADIHRAGPQRDVRPAPALSSARIRLDYQHGDRVRTLFISPAQPRLFLTQLAARDRGLVFSEEDTLIRQSGPILLFANVVKHSLQS